MLVSKSIFLKENVLERSRHLNLFKEQRKVTLFYPETIVYPFVEVTGTKKGEHISDGEISHIISYVESNNMTHI